jgi:CheY-like chemotaxis protein
MRDLLQSTIGGSIRIETRLARGLWPALVDPTQLELAVLNLAINARDAMEVGGTLTVSTSNVTCDGPVYPEEPPAGQYVEICVGDNGTGMSEEVRARVFEPFFTTKEVGKGSGLGLSQVLGFAKQSGGGVRIESRLNQGTSIRIYLPRAASKLTQADAPAWTGQLAQPSGAQVLLVDDDNAVREVTAETLRELGYRVVEAGSGGAALEILERKTDIDLILIDFAMPGMNGAELGRQVQTRWPALPMLFVTGFADRGALAGIAEAQVVRKPFVDGELASKIRALLTQGIGDNVVRLRR